VATYDYFNAAPQLQDFNGVNWAEVEKSVRIYVNNIGKDAFVYTGIYVNDRNIKSYIK
jgi:DNA/RNA endonuclease G (NUC1)